MRITDDILYVGVNDHNIDLFEGQYIVPNGMAYNSYVINDEKIAVMDTVDAAFGDEWLKNIADVLNGATPDYLIIQHMEPDHSANIQKFLEVYPNIKVVGNAKTFTMIGNFFRDLKLADENKLEVKNKDTLTLGKHELTFVFAPMVHWPEVMVIGIVGKYGAQVQNLLKVAATLDIQTICPLHGPVLTENLEHYIGQYNTWSSYGTESEGIMIAYTSVYGNTKKAVELLAEKLKEKGCPKVVVTDLAREDMAEAVEDAFRYGKIVLASTTYNGDVFPLMKTFIEHLTERNYQNKTIGLIENGSWASMAGKVMRGMFEKSKNITWLETSVKIMSSMDEQNKADIEKMAEELM